MIKATKKTKALKKENDKPTFIVLSIETCFSATR